MWSWFKRKRAPEPPSVCQTVIGEVQVDSGTLLLADPSAMYGPVRVESVPPGRYSVHAQVIRYPEGGERIARVGITFRPGTTDVRQPLGTIGVDSATVVAVDVGVYETHWKEVGPERVGRAGAGVGHYRRVVKLIEKQFGLKSREVDVWHAEFVEPISEELEARITAYLQTFPEYAEFTFMYFSVATRNSRDRVSEATRDRLWSEVILDDQSGASLLAFSSGFGDGSYPVEGSFGAGQLRGVEVEFIGPAQDEILEAFPILRY